MKKFITIPLIFLFITLFVTPQFLPETENVVNSPFYPKYTDQWGKDDFVFNDLLILKKQLNNLENTQYEALYEFINSQKLIDNYSKFYEILEDVPLRKKVFTNFYSKLADHKQLITALSDSFSSYRELIMSYFLISDNYNCRKELEDFGIITRCNLLEDQKRHLMISLFSNLINLGMYQNDASKLLSSLLDIQELVNKVHEKSIGMEDLEYFFNLSLYTHLAMLVIYENSTEDSVKSVLKINILEFKNKNRSDFVNAFELKLSYAAEDFVGYKGLYPFFYEKILPRIYQSEDKYWVRDYSYGLGLLFKFFDKIKFSRFLLRPYESVQTSLLLHDALMKDLELYFTDFSKGLTLKNFDETKSEFLLPWNYIGRRILSKKINPDSKRVHELNLIRRSILSIQALISES